MSENRFSIKKFGGIEELLKSIKDKDKEKEKPLKRIDSMKDQKEQFKGGETFSKSGSFKKTEMNDSDNNIDYITEDNNMGVSKRRKSLNESEGSTPKNKSSQNIKTLTNYELVKENYYRTTDGYFEEYSEM
jgi:hypothetical protein